MNPPRTRSAAAGRFFDALVIAADGRTKIGRQDYTATFLSVAPGMATAPERRAHLAALLNELVELGHLRASRALDLQERPPLPRFVRLNVADSDPRVSVEAATFPWRPELSWAAALPMRRSEFEALKAIQSFLRDRGRTAPFVPIAERSLEIFADEKRLDTLRRNTRIFAPGRLSLAMLRAKPFAPPFAFRRVGDGPVALVVENVATYRSVLTSLRANSPVGVVVFGGGANFAASVAYFSEVREEGGPPIEEIRYFGDLDRRGLEIPIQADVVARELGLPAVRPAVALWTRLLEAGRRVSALTIDRAVAERLCDWLPSTVRSDAVDVLMTGHRLAQEAVGTEWLAANEGWFTWAGLGPRRGERIDVGAVRTATPLPVVGEDALRLSDDRVDTTPLNDEAWSQWVSPAQCRNYLLDDPLLDWLEHFGRNAGFARDDERPGYDRRLDFVVFVATKAAAFEEKVLALLSRRAETTSIAQIHEARSFDRALDTVAALRRGVPIVAHAVLRDPQRRVYGIADLLVRSDLLADWFPELLSKKEAAAAALGLGHSRFHYRAVEIKFHTLDLASDGHLIASPAQLAHAAQVWLYSEALGRIQGYLPPRAFILGRNWQQGDDHGSGCLERLGLVDGNRPLRNRDGNIALLAEEAMEWNRRLRAEGEGWSVLPTPSTPELYPHARNREDAPWHTQKRQIARALRELTLLPGMNPTRRRTAFGRGIRAWDAPGVTASRLSIEGVETAARAEAVLAANNSPVPTVVPGAIRIDGWRQVRRCEFFVDFETVSNLDDDFATLPAIGGQPLIFQIGCGNVDDNGKWQFVQWTVSRLVPADEERIIEEWIEHMASGARFDDMTVFHWSAAEPASLETAYNAARSRHPLSNWPILPWYDLLQNLFRAEPIAVTGAFDFSLKSVARAMNAAGLISTTWPDGVVDGLGAMAAAWAAARETPDALGQNPLMLSVAAYNEIDCRAMREILDWLRRNR